MSFRSRNQIIAEFSRNASVKMKMSVALPPGNATHTSPFPIKPQCLFVRLFLFNP